MLPFSREQFFAVFVDYNAGVWPAQIAAYLVGLVVVALLLRPSPAGSRIIGAALAAMWIWIGVAYHGLYFSAINKAAMAFGLLFVLQGAGLLYTGVTGRIGLGSRHGLTPWLGWAFVAYAAVVYPLIGLGSGHRLGELPMFGITPCPVTIFTFGVLLLLGPQVPRWLFVAPFIWSLIGGSAAFLLSVPQDWLLLFSGFVVIPLAFRRSHHSSVAMVR